MVLPAMWMWLDIDVFQTVECCVVHVHVRTVGGHSPGKSEKWQKSMLGARSLLSTWLQTVTVKLK